MKTFVQILFLVSVVFCVDASTTHAQLLQDFLAKEGVAAATAKATAEFNADAKLRAVAFLGISMQGVDLKMDQTTGKATGWGFMFHSQTLDSTAIYVAVKIPFVGLTIQPLPTGTALPTIPGNQQLGQLSEPWIDSDASIKSVMNSGGSTFFQKHSDAKVAMAVAFYSPVDIPVPPLPAGPYWMYRLESASEALLCFVDAKTGNSIGCTSIPTAVEEIPKGKDFALDQNYPNPIGFGMNNDETTIQFQLSDQLFRDGKTPTVTLKLFDALGREVRTLLNTELDPGSYSVPVNISNLPAGTYFYRLSTPMQSETKRLVVTK